MIEIDHLTKDFGTFRAVDSLSFSVEKGEVLGFLGPNGAGKSTSMKMITGYLSPTSGTARILGCDVRKDPISVKNAIGYLPEGAPAWPDMTPVSFLKFIAQIRKISGVETDKAIAEVVDKTNLGNVLHQPIQTLSKGFKRRVGLAQALLHDPEVLIMDEPTDGLDPNQKKDVRDLIQSMSADKAIIVSTHILEEVEVICSRAMIIDTGRIVADGRPEELEAQSERHNAVRLTVAPEQQENAQKLLEGSEVVQSVELIGETGLRALSVDRKPILDPVLACLGKANLKTLEVQVERGRLDDVFRNLTKSDIHHFDNREAQ
ncbi:ABC transporter ATP-binding protein [Curvivirga aplysinae]|uniref:ABC transporter ATP-binding protein n=1 Tax=Curvivirga aplysinae TaxID=2529852 RepID=UPI0012BC8E3A|nr:ABC transporter ATP-binding protein [Curvivirga aplysinae]MTI11315.1 ABC transporter ATP-binding protein [Curvivirga aplysinae]